MPFARRHKWKIIFRKSEQKVLRVGLVVAVQNKTSSHTISTLMLSIFNFLLLQPLGATHWLWLALGDRRGGEI